jgi:putative ABC transport system substrate-binding protein
VTTLAHVDPKACRPRRATIVGSFEHDPGVAADLVAVNPDAIVAWASPSVAAARRAISTIPIVMASVGDLVAGGFVQNLARPGGNVTGVSNVSHDLSSKVVQLIVETAPRIKQIGVVHNPRNPGLPMQLRQTAEAVHALGRQLETVDAGTFEEIDRALQKLKRAGVHGVIFLPDPSRGEPARSASTGGVLRGPHTEGGEARRSSGPAAD